MTRLGITIEVHIKDGDQEYALGMRSDDFRDERLAEGALFALLSSAHYSAYQLLQGKPIENIRHPFYIP